MLSQQDLEDAFADAHDALDVMSMVTGAGPIGATVREMEARKSAASGAAGGFSYAEFYRLLASTPSSQNASGRAAYEDDNEDEDDDDDGVDGEGGFPVPIAAEPQLGNGLDGKEHLAAAIGAVPPVVAAATPEPAPPFATGYQR